MCDLEDPRAIWNDLYKPSRNGTLQDGEDPWLERWRTLLDSANSPILELGCGRGRDTQALMTLSQRVIAADFSDIALRACQQTTAAQLVQVDLRDGLAFVSQSFSLILASLCLHYFAWVQTKAIAREIHRCLKPGGLLLARVNSIHDIHYGAIGHPQIAPNFYLVKGAPKRFFSKNCINKLFGREWQIEHIEEVTIRRYKKPKVVWEIMVRKM